MLGLEVLLCIRDPQKVKVFGLSQVSDCGHRIVRSQKELNFTRTLPKMPPPPSRKIDAVKHLLKDI